MQRNARTVIAGISAAAVLSAIAAPAALAADASTPSPATASTRVAQERALLGGGLLGGLLGGTVKPPATPVPTTVVTGLVGSLLTLPGGTGAGTSTVTNLVNSVLGAGVPANASVITGLLGSVLPVAGKGGAAPTAVVTDLIGGLLGQGVGLTNLTSVVNGILGSAGASPVGLDVVNGIVGGLLATGMPTDASSLTGLLGLLNAGALPTAGLLAPVTDLLDQVAANTVLPQPVRDAVKTLSNTIKGTGTATLTDTVMRTVGGVLGVLGQNGSVAKPVQDILGLLSGLLTGASTSPTKPGSTTPAQAGQTKYIYATTPGSNGTARNVKLGAMRARVTRVQVNRSRTTATATLSCPVVAVLGCDVRVKPTFAGHVAGAQKRVLLAPGTQRKVSLGLTQSSVKRTVKKGGRLVVRATTLVSTHSFSASRMIQLSRAR